ncbi:MAG: AAA family ATPase [Candidatus Altiarchaeales archaeon]|nr:AAA family ATPase [Candidatus Altiarchaeales archaeon]
MASKNNRRDNNRRSNDKNKPVRERQFSKLKEVSPRNEHQSQYLESIENNSVVIASGPAGTGKTYLAVYEALGHHWAKKMKRIVIARPAIEAGEKIGFLPGGIEDKLNPYLRPIFDSLYDIIGVELTNQKIERGYVEIAPLAYMRGRTFNNCFVIMDEAQNATFNQLVMAVTRVGDNCKMVINGDPYQSDLPVRSGQKSGIDRLQDALEEVRGVSVIRFDRQDVVRSKIVTDIIGALDKYEEENN